MISRNFAKIFRSASSLLSWFVGKTLAVSTRVELHISLKPQFPWLYGEVGRPSWMSWDSWCLCRWGAEGRMMACFGPCWFSSQMIFWKADFFLLFPYGWQCPWCKSIMEESFFWRIACPSFTQEIDRQLATAARAGSLSFAPCRHWDEGGSASLLRGDGGIDASHCR